MWGSYGISLRVELCVLAPLVWFWKRFFVLFFGSSSHGGAQQLRLPG